MDIQATVTHLPPARGDGGAPREHPAQVSVACVEGAVNLAGWVPEWDDLATASTEPNVFYEPWQVLPAMDAFGSAGPLIHLFVFHTDPADATGRRRLCAYFPLERVRRFRGLPVPVLTLWKHLHCFLCTPLIRPGCAMHSLNALFDWARTDDRGASIIQFPQIAGDGLFKTALLEFLGGRQAPVFVFGTYSRALFTPREDPERYLLAAVSTKSRKQIRRLGRRIAEVGRVDYKELGPTGDLETWVADFMQLEASGWKGRADSALACHEPERRFFTHMTRAAFQRRRLMMLAMLLDGRPVAMKCNLLAHPGSFAFKIAFDEAFARFSPGVLLEVENIRRLHGIPGLSWMDSCAVSNHSMANRIWIDRRTIQTLAIATGRPMGDFFVSAMPLVRWLAHRFLRARPAEAAGIHIGEDP